eukprot:6202936-Pleurochrysis_carterae.AAC.2
MTKKDGVTRCAKEARQRSCFKEELASTSIYVGGKPRDATNRVTRRDTGASSENSVYYGATDDQQRAKQNTYRQGLPRLRWGGEGVRRHHGIMRGEMWEP